MEKTVHTAVRELVEFVLRKGDIDFRYTGSKRMAEGVKIHKKLQKRHMKEAKNNGYVYESEYPLNITLEYNGFLFDIDGRADGVLECDDGVYIEEIKSTARELNDISEEDNPFHMAQAKCYGYMYALKNNTENIMICLTYCKLETYEERTFEEKYTFLELKEYFYDILKKYFFWVELSYNNAVKRNSTINSLDFPFGSFRKGQRELAAAVYKTLVSEKKLFAVAPTGTGKTVSTIFPSLKYMAFKDLPNQKLFYLTAKTTTRRSAEELFLNMSKNGLYIKAVSLTAKEKLCFCDEVSCNPKKCKYAKGHFDRVNEALKDIFCNEECMFSDKISLYAKKHEVCPYEFSLDVASFADTIICDYNYAFDPSAKLKRFFSEGTKGHFTVLIDEAHNLVERAREMFSAELKKSEFLKARRLLNEKMSPLYKSLTKINNYFLSRASNIAENESIRVSRLYPDDFVLLLMDFTSSCDKWLSKNEGHKAYESVLSLYFDVFSFLNAAELFDVNYITFEEFFGREISFKLLCLNPSDILKNEQKKHKSTIFFSATLTPIKYFMDILGGSEGDNTIGIPSPFERERLCVMVDTSVSTKYADREQSYEKIADRIFWTVSEKHGNYLIFFSSYEYMNKVFNIFSEKYKNIKTIIQTQGFSDKEKNDFLDNFKENTENIFLAFAVLGGAFSEGIDLTENRLIGTVIVGVGLPLITEERNCIKDYYDKKLGMGFEYAYVYPGMNKVLQAGGRVIRTKKDKGVILLIDSRFLNYPYKKLFPYEWASFINVKGKEDLKKALKIFWK